MLRVVAGLFLLGGTVRLLANGPLFDALGTGELWSDAAHCWQDQAVGAGHAVERGTH